MTESLLLKILDKDIKLHIINLKREQKNYLDY